MNILIFNTFIIWILILLSVIATAVILERLFFFKKYKLSDISAFMTTIKNSLHSSISDEKVQIAISFCKQEQETRPIASLVKTLLVNHQKDQILLEKIMTNESNKFLSTFEHRLFLLNTIASVSPLLGLLGTVIGMIKSFFSISQGNLESSYLASGISEALLTTALGLVVAIPCLVSYNFFVRKIDNFTEQIEININEIITLIKY